MDKAFIDESGYTGRDLLSVAQPFMVLSALFISEKDAADLKQQHFPHSQAAELKHKTLAKRPRNWKPLIELQRECLNRFRGISYVVNKRYLCIRKFLDDCIEPASFANGIDYYEHGHDQLLANVLYFTGPTVFGKENFDRLLHLYQHAAGTKQLKDIEALCDHALTLTDRELGEVLIPIAFRHSAVWHEMASPDAGTNPVSPMLFGLVSQLEKKANGAYSVTHDTSEAMSQYHKVLEELTHTESASFQISDVAGISFPLKLQEVLQADSHSSVALQLADILAGSLVASAKVLSGLVTPNDYTANLLDLYGDDNLMFLLPTPDLEEIKKRFANTEGAKMIKYFARKPRLGS